MSIRMRLTLLYSTILALTLVVFGVVLYSIQARETRRALERDLETGIEMLKTDALRMNSVSTANDRQHGTPPPKSFRELSDDQSFQDIQEREILRILDPDGNLVASPFGRNEDALPLSEEGLAAVQAKQEWWEEADVGDEHMLILSQAVIQGDEVVLIVQAARPLTERDRTLQSLAVTLAGTGFVMILAAFGAGWALSGATLQPIHRLTETAGRIGRERDFSRRVDYSGPEDEVGRLAGTFNRMLTNLQEAYQKVEDSLQMQRDFVAEVSHELRTPLTTLRGNLGLLRRDPPAPPEEQADILDDMVEESDRLIRLVNDLLLMARADAGRKLDKKTIEVQPLVEDTIRQIQMLDENRCIELEVERGTMLLGDRDAFKQVLMILLDNALKHSEGEISVAVCRVDGSVEISVRDRGPGIPEEQLDHVFERFYRGADSALKPGIGLGLPIARSLVEGMGGRIHMDSLEGEGSVILLRFPVP